MGREKEVEEMLEKERGRLPLYSEHYQPLLVRRCPGGNVGRPESGPTVLEVSSFQKDIDNRHT